jgi:hypothetical protein
MRFFNTAGPVVSTDHYCLPPLERFNLTELLSLINQKKYFVLHAPRQTGKTTCLLALMDYLNKQGKVKCLYMNVEIAQSAREDVYEGIRAIMGELSQRADNHIHDSFCIKNWQTILNGFGGHKALNGLLTEWCKQSDKPIVLLMDEIDSLIGDTLISVLRQLRAGYDKRPLHFPQSIILCGVRDVRDYRIHSDSEKTVITGGSAFNIRAESLRLGDFTEQEMRDLYGQHTGETGRMFLPESLELAWEYTNGQPWIVNALGYETCFRLSEENCSSPITVEMMAQAKENLILRRETHLDQLADKLKEDRVFRVIHPMLQGLDMDKSVTDEDVQYLLDLGLVRQSVAGMVISNAIYREIIPRQITHITQLNLENRIQPTWYIREDGFLDMKKLLSAFQEFFQEHSEHWIERFDYKEAGPQLLLQAFMQRIVNGGGRIEREYGLGRMRTDLLVIWQAKEQAEDTGQMAEGIRHQVKTQRVVIELKILYKSLKKTQEDGLKQTWEYMDRCRADQGHLVIFDRSSKKSWKKKLFVNETNYQGRAITVWGM